eukprot:1273345-Pleurochrysis_carterae.AAC.2
MILRLTRQSLLEGRPSFSKECEACAFEAYKRAKLQAVDEGASLLQASGDARVPVHAHGSERARQPAFV